MALVFFWSEKKTPSFLLLQGSTPLLQDGDDDAYSSSQKISGPSYFVYFADNKFILYHWFSVKGLRSPERLRQAIGNLDRHGAMMLTATS